MKDERFRQNNAAEDDLHQFCKALHEQTGIFLRISNSDDLASLAGVVKLSCSPALQADFKRLQAPGH